MTCWNAWPMRLWRSTVQDGLGLSIWKICRRAFVYEEELLGCLSNRRLAASGESESWLGSIFV